MYIGGYGKRRAQCNSLLHQTNLRGIRESGDVKDDTSLWSARTHYLVESITKNEKGYALQDRG